MNEQQQMLADMADGLFAELGPKATVAGHWGRIAEAGLTGLLVSDANGGFGGSWADALLVFRLAGYHALALPLVEAVVAARLSGVLDGLGSLAMRCEGVIDNGAFTGTVGGIAWGRDADYVIAAAPDGGAMLLRRGDATVREGRSIAGEPRDAWVVERAACTPIDGIDVAAIGAFVRVAQSAGALDAALALAVAHVNDRKQFGRPLAKFQAVQQSLATLACEAAAVNCAALAAAMALDARDASYAVAAAKTRAGEAIGEATAIAHQVHGAIGFTEEYGLHPLTRRLWCWRSEFGGDGHWASVLGGRIAAAGPARFWPDLTAIST
ncbi:acyl-CoA/acyl-ACP dehydrogenase [Sphingomonas sp. MG17]|uniref:Acyl-CoA/acyl-ACP dehydrogenase n=1 Tax=Sphingomonas tagetis TaxID=2949092 RepID=A0A9X2KM37_9SPHN|nr:acyl-CoA dehydrogenase family protein [Sphingomonas tagetis]MCP3731262.1 acyl-CoA/acyl-ACP dehydrogenase [Sphingomonas tagetis]